MYTCTFIQCLSLVNECLKYETCDIDDKKIFYNGKVFKILLLLARLEIIFKNEPRKIIDIKNSYYMKEMLKILKDV